MDKILSRLRLEIRNIFRTENNDQAEVSFMIAYRFFGAKVNMPQMENPYLYLVIDGALRLYTPSGIMDYMAGQYSISKIDTPLYGTVLFVPLRHQFTGFLLRCKERMPLTTYAEISCVK